jgi:hypothetical protein
VKDSQLRRSTDNVRSRRWVDVLFVAVMTFVVIGVLVMAALLYNINQRQIAGVSQQNDAQLCAQHDITVAVRKIGLKLGLPVEDIVPPDVEGLNCP